ncbi:MAG: CotH kinase family protein, partial [Pirellulales bacterium]
MVLQLQGESVDTLTDTPGQFLERTYTVDVNAETNGQLTVVFWSTRPGEEAVINGLAISPAAGGPSLQCDCGTADSAVAAGYTRVTEADLYSAQTGYGWKWGGNNVAGEDRGQRGLHTNFSLSEDGEYLALVRPDLTVAADFGPEYPPQTEDVSYGIPAGGSAAVFLATATPGQPNSLERGSPVLLDRASGVFSAPFLLALSVDAAAATIHFTTDGTEPTEASPVYSTPLAIDATTVVKAISVEPGVAPSPVASGWFMKMAADLADFSSDLPIMVFDSFATAAGGWVASPVGFQFNAMALFEPDAATGRSSLTATPDVTSRSGLQLQISSAVSFPKKPMYLKLWDESNRDRNVSLLGMPAESDWALFAPHFYDRALIRNAFIYALSNQVGRYQTQTRFVEVFYNRSGGDVSAADYVGVYLLIEKIKRGPNRVDITKLEPHDNAEPEISGGWLLKIGRPDSASRGFTSDADVEGPQFIDPPESEVTPEQAAWIKDDFNAMFASLRDTNPETGYEQTIDVDSW